MTTPEEHIAALKNLLAFAEEDSNPDLNPWELAALEWAIAELSPQGVTISGNVSSSSNSLAVKKEGEHGQRTTATN